MSRHFDQMRHGSDDARSGLRERLRREAIGDAAYEETVSKSDDGAFRIVGLVLIVLVGAVVLGITMAGF